MVTYSAGDCADVLRSWKPGVVSESATSRTVVGADKDLTGQSVLALRDQFVSILEDVPDPDEQKNLIAIFYTQVRCQWTLRNIQSGYQIASGVINQSLYRQSGLLTELLKELEPFVGPAEVARITRSVGEQAEGSPVTMAEQSSTAENPSLPELSLDLANLKKEADAASSQREILEAEFGSSDADFVVEHARELQKRLVALEDLQTMLGSLEETVYLVNI